MAEVSATLLETDTAKRRQSLAILLFQHATQLGL